MLKANRAGALPLSEHLGGPDRSLPMRRRTVAEAGEKREADCNTAIIWRKPVQKSGNLGNVGLDGQTAQLRGPWAV